MSTSARTRSSAALLQELSAISDVISQHTDEAARSLEAFKARNPQVRHRPVTAMVELLSLIIGSIQSTYDKQGIDDIALVAYFKKEKKYDEAAQVLLSRARHFFMNSNVAEGEKVLIEVKEQLLGRISLRSEVVYLTRMAFIHGKRYQYDEKLKVSLQALDRLKAMGEPDIWHLNISTIFYTNIAGCYMANGAFDQALPYLEQSLAITEMPGVSLYNRFNVYSCFTVFYEEQKDYHQCTAWYEKIIALLRGDATHTHYLIQSYMMATVQYHFLLRYNEFGKKKYNEIVARQESHLREASALIQPDLMQGPYIQLLYSSATLAYQKKEYQKAADLLDQCLPAYIRLKNDISILNCCRLAHEVYYAWGRETGDAAKLVKAYDLKQQESKMVEERSQQSHLQKMEAVQVKYDLQQAELNSKLLKQQVEAMNKEAQLTALNLQEKVALLDELKTFVQSLRRKDYDGREFARAVSQRIGTVKITEQDKAVMQQKIDQGNHSFFTMIGEMYPILTPHEVRTCALLKTGLTDKELSRLYGSGERGYEQLRHRIKKKMNLTRGDNLVKHLMELSAKAQGV